jgi:hypothetical protein
MKDSAKMTMAELATEVDRLRGLINTPRTDEFLEAVRTEAAHQIERWGEDDRGKKNDLDWIWLMAYLSAKVIVGKTQQARAFADNTQGLAMDFEIQRAGRETDGREKYLHRIITIAAAALNWHRNRWPGKQP